MIPLPLAELIVFATIAAIALIWGIYVPKWRKNPEPEEDTWQRSVEMGEG